MLKNNNDKLWVWEPSDLNNRIPIQHSVFIFGETEINQNLAHKIRIDKKEKYLILSELWNFHHIDAITLFYDFTGFAKENSCEKPYLTEEHLTIMDKVRLKYYSLPLITDKVKKNQITALLDDAIAINKTSYEARIFRSSLNLQLKNISKAMKDCDKLIEMYPDDSDSYFLRGQAKFQLDQYKEAKKYLEKSLELNPKNFKDSASRLLKYINDIIS